jgi:DUF1680 family protein
MTDRPSAYRVPPSGGETSFPPATFRILTILLCLVTLPSLHAATNLLFNSPSQATLRLDGFGGERLRLTTENWLNPAPFANPGMLEMFQVRDREPAPNLVPWAGEFVGKYLISAIQAQRLGAKISSLEEIVSQLIASQADDGYLGPFPKKERLLGHWDLWGHYHCMLALLMWHQDTGDARALECVTRAADLVCKIYLDTGKRAIDAGSDEMNLSIIHALGWLYRITSEPRYLRMMHEIEKDWERGGDFVRTGLAGIEFFQTPRPRWEGLHSLQGLVELYRITGDEKYRRAFVHHWRSIARWDLRNTGGFSSGEQATGDPYAPTAIETCCSIAWMAMSIDMLKLTGDSRVADLLELATLNAWAGAQHPSGRWCTYNTPMDGAREASAHSIVFQSRAGTPELNCCSVNGPRGWGMLSDWALMETEDGYAINWLGPFVTSLPGTIQTNRLAPAPPLEPERRYFRRSTTNSSARPQLYVTGNYPIGSNVEIHVVSEYELPFTLRVRIPEWSKNTRVTLNDEVLPAPQPGTYLTLARKWDSHWRRSDRVKITLDMQPRAVVGAREAVGKVCVYRGPLLLAWDQRFNSYDESALPALDPAALAGARPFSASAAPSKLFDPLAVLQLPGIILCDFATAGALGTRYKSWLPATNIPPAPVVTRFPRDGATIARGTVGFRWTGSPKQNTDFYSLQIGETENFTQPILKTDDLTASQTLVQIADQFQPQHPYYWRVVSRNAHGTTASTGPAAVFYIDPSLPLANESLPTRPSGDIVKATMTNGILNGLNQKLTYTVGEWPEENYAIELRFKVLSFPANRIGQVFSAWAGAVDDPLRLTIDKGKLFARLEMGGSYTTEGVPVEIGKWYRVKAVKEGSKLRLFLDGKERGSCFVPQFIVTRAKDFALGGNPHYTGNEHLAAEFSEVLFREP